jgi:hypothetical protein
MRKIRDLLLPLFVAVTLFALDLRAQVVFADLRRR